MVSLKILQNRSKDTNQSEKWLSNKLAIHSAKNKYCKGIEFMYVNRFDVNQKKTSQDSFLWERGRKNAVYCNNFCEQAGSQSAGRKSNSRVIQHHLNDSFQYLFNELNEIHWNISSSHSNYNKNGGDTSQQMLMNGNKSSPVSHGWTTTTFRLRCLRFRSLWEKYSRTVSTKKEE